MVDNQNMNARYLDKFSTGTTSIRTHAPPGGKSTFSLGWGDDTKQEDTKKSKNVSYGYGSKTNTDDYPTNNKKSFKNLGGKQDQESNSFQPSNTEKTSVKVKYAPGGQSSIKFG